MLRAGAGFSFADDRALSDTRAAGSVATRGVFLPYPKIPQEKPMDELNFTAPAFKPPATRAEYSALLDAALRLGDELSTLVDSMSSKLAANAANKRQASF